MRPSSHQTYRGYIDNHIKPNIRRIPLEKLTSLELQKLYKKLLTSGRIDRVESKHQAKGLSPKTSRNIHQIIASAMKLAKEQRLIVADPTEGYALPKLEHREMKTLPVEQLASFLREAKDTRTPPKRSALSGMSLYQRRPYSFCGSIGHGKVRSGSAWGSTTGTRALCSPRTMEAPCTRTA